ncbi:unnamed protein product [Ectocarpus sp. 12 AP-2014]
MMRRVCRPMRAGMVVLLFALTIGLPVSYFCWCRGFSLVGGLAAPPEDGEGSVTLITEGSGGTVTVPAQGRVGRGAVPPEGGKDSAEIDGLLHEDPRSFYTIYYDAEAITLQHKGARVRLDNTRKEYLNRLVEASALDTGNQVSNVAFVKTRDTGSTTLGTLLHRYGRRHNLQVAHFPGYGSTIPIVEAAKMVSVFCVRVFRPTERSAIRMVITLYSMQY